MTAAVWLVDARTVDESRLRARFCWLTAGEAQRYHRFIRPQRQRQFLVGRVLLRIALGELLGCAPSTLNVVERSGQSPTLQCPGAMPGFSIAHSGDWIACAVSADSMLGLDIEVMDDGRDMLALAAQVFSQQDVRALATLQGERRLRAFYELWSRREAAYKLRTAGVAPADEYFSVLAHPELSVVLCTDRPVTAIRMSDAEGLRCRRF